MMIDPEQSEALYELFVKGRAQLTKEEEKAYNTWFFWHTYFILPQEWLNNNNKDQDPQQIIDFCVKMDKLYQEGVRIQRLRQEKNKARPIHSRMRR